MLRDYLRLPLPVRILCLGSLINRAGSFVLIFLTIYASQQLGFGVTFATACMGILGLGSMAGSVLGGQLADQIGRKRVMLIALWGGAGMLIVIGALDNRWAFMAMTGLFALISDMYRPAASAMIADLVTEDRRPHAFALMYISINLGFAIAPPLGGLLAEYSFQWLFWGDALTMSLYGLIIVTLIRESHPGQDRKNARGDNHEPAVPFRQAGIRIARDVTFLLFCLSSLLMALVFMQGMSTLPIYIRQSGFSNFQFGLLMSINGVLIFLLQLPITHWLSR
ncbi:MAG: MFS transporter, partial [Pirellulales bacterium]|nr:MFS transporter [Pirellulales bacterium]